VSGNLRLSRHRGQPDTPKWRASDIHRLQQAAEAGVDRGGRPLLLVLVLELAKSQGLLVCVSMLLLLRVLLRVLVHMRLMVVMLPVKLRLMQLLMVVLLLLLLGIEIKHKLWCHQLMLLLFLHQTQLKLLIRCHVKMTSIADVSNIKTVTTARRDLRGTDIFTFASCTAAGARRRS
jgi:hypothetical protein